MEAEAKEVLAQLLQRAVDGVDAAVAFSQQQIPEVVEQLLLWHTVKSIGWCLLSAIFLGLWLWVCSVMRASNQYDGDVIVFAGSTIILWLCAIVSFDTAWLQIILAPKLYLLEYAATFVK